VRARQELLRIQVPNLECLCTGITGSGSTLITGWDDGKIRAFFPESGRMKFVIADAHSDKVTALAIADDDRGTWRIISGGGEGRVRIWEVTHSHRALITSLKEHRGAVNSIKVNKTSTQAISASSDGSCIVWDLGRYVRIVAFFDPNVFTSVLYHPDESQMLTCGSNHKITYWDAVDGQAIRVIDGSETAAMTSLDVEPSGEFFVSGSQDRSLKVWHYDEGLPMAVGHGHRFVPLPLSPLSLSSLSLLSPPLSCCLCCAVLCSLLSLSPPHPTHTPHTHTHHSGSITAVKISPDGRTIVSTGSTGEIIFWEMPPLEGMRLLAEH
jgi:WD40 repeat protein